MRLYVLMYVFMVACIQSYGWRIQPYLYTYLKRTLLMQNPRKQTRSIPVCGVACSTFSPPGPPRATARLVEQPSARGRQAQEVVKREEGRSVSDDFTQTHSANKHTQLTVLGIARLWINYETH